MSIKNKDRYASKYFGFDLGKYSRKSGLGFKPADFRQWLELGIAQLRNSKFWQLFGNVLILL